MDVILCDMTPRYCRWCPLARWQASHITNTLVTLCSSTGAI